MNVFYCPCGYTFILNLESAKVIGPIYHSEATGRLYIGNNSREFSMAEFRDYGDCWTNLLNSIPTGKS